MDVRPDEEMEGGVFAPYGGKYEGSGRDRGLTPFPRTSEEQGSKIQKRGAESTLYASFPMKVKMLERDQKRIELMKTLLDKDDGDRKNE